MLPCVVPLHILSDSVTYAVVTLFTVKGKDNQRVERLVILELRLKPKLSEVYILRSRNCPRSRPTAHSMSSRTLGKVREEYLFSGFQNHQGPRYFSCNSHNLMKCIATCMHARWGLCSQALSCLVF